MDPLINQKTTERSRNQITTQPDTLILSMTPYARNAYSFIKVGEVSTSCKTSLDMAVVDLELFV